MDLTKLTAALIVLGNAVLTGVLVVFEFSITDVEKGALYVVVTTTVGFGVALYAHFRPTQPRYPVAVGLTFVAWTESVLGVLVVFDTFGLTKDKATVLQGIVVAAVSLVALLLAQSKVTPVEDAVARERVAQAASLRKPPPDGHA